MDKQQVFEILDAANDVHKLADVIYEGIPALIEAFVRDTTFVDNGIAVLPYENFNMETDGVNVMEWEARFIADAMRLAFWRWCQGE